MGYKSVEAQKTDQKTNKYYFLRTLLFLFKKFYPPKFKLKISDKTEDILRNSDKKIIFVADHSDLIIILFYFLFEKKLLIDPFDACTLTSESKEGKIANYFISKKGIFCISRRSLKNKKEDSQSRMKSLKVLLKHFIDEKRYLLMALNEKDENNLSRYSSSSILAAKKAEALIIPVSCSSKIDIKLNKNWDLMKIPLASKYINIGDPIDIRQCDWDHNRTRCTQKLLHVFKKLDLENIKNMRVERYK